MEDIEQAPFRTAMYVYELRKLLRYIRNADCITKSSVFYVRFLSTPRTVDFTSLRMSVSVKREREA